MDEKAKCHKFAVKEVLGAVGLLQGRAGASARDIYFVLDHLHGRVQRPVISCALKTAVNKGLLDCVNNHYKLRRQQGAGMRLRTNTISRSRRARHVTRSHSSSSLSEADYSGSGGDVPVRNFIVSPVRRARRSGRTMYRFREVSSVETCNCSECSIYSDSDGSSVHSVSSYECPPRIKTKRTTKRYPVPKQIKVEKNSSNESNVKDKREVQNERNFTGGTLSIVKGKTINGCASSCLEGHKEPLPQPETAPKELAKLLGITLNKRYSLRPRKTRQPQKSPAQRKQAKKAIQAEVALISADNPHNASVA